jgi:Leucine-rich repeat (LRR) protein
LFLLTYTLLTETFIQDPWNIQGKLKGTLPKELSVFDEMRYFELQWRGNDLTGTIPSGIGANRTKLTTFLARDNSLNGTFPLTNNPLLETLDLRGNQIEDNVQSVFSLNRIRSLHADDNKFTGTLSESMTDLQYLSKIDGLSYLIVLLFVCMYLSVHISIFSFQRR